LFGTLMRHFFAMSTHPIGVAASAEVTALVPTAGLTQRRRPRRSTAADAAVAIAAITATAEEEDLAAFGAAADDESQRVHSESLARQKLDAAADSCDQMRAALSTASDPQRARSVRSGLSPYLRASDCTS
jgi:hypothetical protein